MAEITQKYFSRAVGANVTFGRGADNGYSCDIVAPVMRGVVLKASHSAREPQMAFNGAADRMRDILPFGPDLATIAPLIAVILALGVCPQIVLAKLDARPQTTQTAQVAKR